MRLRSLVCCRTVITIKDFEIMIRGGHLEGFVLTNGQPTITRLTRIQANVWTQVAVRVIIHSVYIHTRTHEICTF